MPNDAQQTMQEVADVHATIVQQFLTTSRCPDREMLSSLLELPREVITERLLRLEEIHGAVLHPHVPEPWIVHPFCSTPTLNWVASADRSWWAPCIWCALGIAALARDHIRIHSRLAGEETPIVIDVENGSVRSHDDILVHFAIPPRRAWDNPHQHCALMLPFGKASEIDFWCHRHGLPRGEVVPLRQVADLASRWYGPYAERSWRKWSMEQAQEIFAECGLTSPFWELSGTGIF
jgi:Alkylmercury lyase